MKYAGPAGAVQFIYCKQAVLNAFPENDVTVQKELEYVIRVFQTVLLKQLRTFCRAHSLKSRSVSSTSIRTVVISALLNILKKERNLVTLAQTAVHHADNGNRGLDAEFHIGLTVYVLLKYEPCALSVKVEA